MGSEGRNNSGSPWWTKRYSCNRKNRLNVLQRMSRIATETKRLTGLMRGYKTRVAATRKAPLRYLDKKAVFLGGGLTHRFGLWDLILVKENHLEVLKSNDIKD